MLAGGAGRRLAPARAGAASKAAVPLLGRPLVAHPLRALGEACARVVVVCKPSTALPEIAAERWDEPEAPRHPLVGIVHALERAARPVLVCAADMPYVSAGACRQLIEAWRAAGSPEPVGVGRPPPAVVAAAGDGLEPLLGLYTPAALPGLRAAPPDAPLRATVASLGPRPVALPAQLLRSVNTPADLAAAQAVLSARGPPPG